jgi:hypothetical protein
MKSRARKLVEVLSRAFARRNNFHSTQPIVMALKQAGLRVRLDKQGEIGIIDISDEGDGHDDFSTQMYIVEPRLSRHGDADDVRYGRQDFEEIMDQFGYEIGSFGGGNVDYSSKDGNVTFFYLGNPSHV